MSLGIHVDRLRRRSFIIVSLLTAAAVSFIGTIGFVGLIAPHMARSLVGEDHRFALPLAAVTGAVILIGASVVGKILSPGGANSRWHYYRRRGRADALLASSCAAGKGALHES